MAQDPALRAHQPDPGDGHPQQLQARRHPRDPRRAGRARPAVGQRDRVPARAAGRAVRHPGGPPDRARRVRRPRRRAVHRPQGPRLPRSARRARPGAVRARLQGAARAGGRLQLELSHPAGLPDPGRDLERRPPPTPAHHDPHRAQAGRDPGPTLARVRASHPDRRRAAGRPRHRDRGRLRSRRPDHTRRRAGRPPHPRRRRAVRRLAHAARRPGQGDAGDGQRRHHPRPVPTGPASTRRRTHLHQRHRGRSRRRLHQGQRAARKRSPHPVTGGRWLRRSHPVRLAHHRGPVGRPNPTRGGTGQRGPVGEHRLPGAWPQRVERLRGPDPRRRTGPRCRNHLLERLRR